MTSSNASARQRPGVLRGTAVAALPLQRREQPHGRLASAGFTRHTYDGLAKVYDDLWSGHVVAPQERLTNALKLVPGERVADLGCGTGVHTVEMAKRVMPGELLAIDPSREMLGIVARRAALEEVNVKTRCADANAFMDDDFGLFDAVSLRFCLAYVEWRDLLAGLAARLRPGGRLGILSSLSTSVPQAWAAYTKLMDAAGLQSAQPNTPTSSAELVQAMTSGGIATDEVWVEDLRLGFPSGLAAAHWLRNSGYVVHPALEAADAGLLDLATQAIGRTLDEFAHDGVVPLDFNLVGVTGHRE